VTRVTERVVTCRGRIRIDEPYNLVLHTTAVVNTERSSTMNDKGAQDDPDR
jgi:hypothetical protein